MICSKCGEDKLESDFVIDRRWRRGRGYLCKSCRSEYHKEYYKNNREKFIKRTSQWVKDNPEKHRVNGQKFRASNPTSEQNRALKKRYNVTLEEYEQLLEEQAGVCAICGQPEKTKDYSGAIRKLSLDHNHITNKPRGLLCNNCNDGIGKLGDDIGMLEKAVEYLKRYE